MENLDFIIVELLQSFLGQPRSSSGGTSRKQWEFNCPTPQCRNDHKFNLNYQSEKKIFRCWKCNFSGFVHKIVKNYGASQYKKLLLLLPTERLGLNLFNQPQIDYSLVTCELPKEYRPVLQGNHRQALDYLRSRKVSDAQIDRLEIGVCTSGPYRNRVIIPSRNKAGRINYFEARDYTGRTNVTYLKPDEVHKSHIIFNELNINWNLPVYLFEGIFDSIRVLNSIPMLGKEPSDLLILMIMRHNPEIIVGIDGDAFRKAFKIFENLSSLGTDVKLIDMSGLPDISKIYEDYGKSGLREVLGRARKMDFVDRFVKMINE